MAIIFLNEIHVNAKHEYNILIHSSVKERKINLGIAVMLYELLFLILSIGPYRFGLFHHDSTEVAVQKMIEASQRMLRINSQGGDGADGI